MGYLWTRLNLARLYSEAEWEAAQAQAKREAELRAAEILPTTAATPKGKWILWVDDLPANNDAEMTMLKHNLGVEIEPCVTTDDAIKRIKADPGKYSLVISDMARPRDRQAGYTLLKQLRGQDFTKPFIIYSSSGRPEHDAEARRNGAEGSTNSPLKLLELVSDALRRAG